MHFLMLAESRLCVHHVGSTGLPAESGRRVVWWKMELWFGFWGVFMHINIVHFPWEEFLVHQEEDEEVEQCPTDWGAVERGTAGCSKNPSQGKSNPIKTQQCTCWFQEGLNPAVMPRVSHGTDDSPGHHGSCGCAGCAPQARLVQPCDVVSPLPAHRSASSTVLSPSPGPASSQTFHSLPTLGQDLHQTQAEHLVHSLALAP